MCCIFVHFNSGGALSSILYFELVTTTELYHILAMDDVQCKSFEEERGVRIKL